MTDHDSTQIFQPKKQTDNDKISVLGSGQRVGNFVIEKVLGVGGFGIVYLAHQDFTERRVAIKEFFPSTMVQRDSSSTVRLLTATYTEDFAKGMTGFVKEAQTLARLNHSGLVQVLHFWEENGTAYMAMPYYEGQTLAQAWALEDFKATPDFIQALLDGLLPTLSYLHDHHVYHRDISPDNIFILKSGQPLLLDFGSARKIVESVTNVTKVIKPSYAPPEQYNDLASDQGAWTDIYALSAVLYQLITGKVPPASVTRFLNDTIVPLAPSYSHIYAIGLLQAIDVGLTLRPSERPASISEWKRLISHPTLDNILPIGISTDNPKSISKTGMQVGTAGTEKLDDTEQLSLDDVLQVSEPAVPLDDVPQVSEPAMPLDDVPQAYDSAVSLDDVPQVSEPAMPLDDVPQAYDSAVSLDDVLQVSEPAVSLDDVLQVSEPAVSLDDVLQVFEPAVSLDDVLQVSKPALLDKGVFNPALLDSAVEVVSNISNAPIFESSNDGLPSDSKIIVLPPYKPKRAPWPWLLAFCIIVAAVFVFRIFGYSVDSEGISAGQLSAVRQVADLSSRIDNQIHAIDIQVSKDKKQKEDLLLRIHRETDVETRGALQVSLLEVSEHYQSWSLLLNEAITLREAQQKKSNSTLRLAEEALSKKHHDEVEKLYLSLVPQLKDLLSNIETRAATHTASRTDLINRLNGRWAVDSCSRNASIWKVSENVLHVVGANNQRLATEKIVAAYDSKVFTVTLKENSVDMDYTQAFEYVVGKQTLEVRQGGKKQILKSCDNV